MEIWKSLKKKEKNLKNGFKYEYISAHSFIKADSRLTDYTKTPFTKKRLIFQHDLRN